jgi:fimbrial isopeptide formation D2 family protein
MKKRSVVSVLLVIAMIASMFPGVSFADKSISQEGEAEVPVVSVAVQAAEGNESVVVPAAEENESAAVQAEEENEPAAAPAEEENASAVAPAAGEKNEPGAGSEEGTPLLEQSPIEPEAGASDPLLLAAGPQPEGEVDPDVFYESLREPTLYEIQQAALSLMDSAVEGKNLNVWRHAFSPMALLPAQNVEATVKPLSSPVKTGKGVYFVGWIKFSGIDFKAHNASISVRFEFDDRYFSFSKATDFYGQDISGFTYDPTSKSGSYTFDGELTGGETYLAVFSFASKNGITPNGTQIKAKMRFDCDEGKTSESNAAVTMESARNYNLTFSSDAETYAPGSKNTIDYFVSLSVPALSRAMGSLLLKQNEQIVISVTVPPTSAVSGLAAPSNCIVESGRRYTSASRSGNVITFTFAYPGAVADGAEQFTTRIRMRGTVITHAVAMPGNASYTGYLDASAHARIAYLGDASPQNTPPIPLRVHVAKEPAGGTFYGYAYNSVHIPLGGLGNNLGGDTAIHLDSPNANYSGNAIFAGAPQGVFFSANYSGKIYPASGAQVSVNKLCALGTVTLHHTNVKYAGAGYSTPKLETVVFTPTQQSWQNMKVEYVQIHQSLLPLVTKGLNRNGLPVYHPISGVIAVEYGDVATTLKASKSYSATGSETFVNIRDIAPNIGNYKVKKVTVTGGTNNTLLHSPYVTSATRPAGTGQYRSYYSLGFYPQAQMTYSVTPTLSVNYAKGGTIPNLFANKPVQMRVANVANTPTVYAYTHIGEKDEVFDVGTHDITYTMGLPPSSVADIESSAHYIGIAAPSGATMNISLNGATFVKQLANTPAAGETLYIWRYVGGMAKGASKSFTGKINITRFTPHSFKVKAYYLNDIWPDLHAAAGYGSIGLTKRDYGNTLLGIQTGSNNHKYVYSAKDYVSGQNPHGLQTRALVRGDLDGAFGAGPARASTAPSGFADYKLEIENKANTKLRAFYTVITLPRPGDKGIADASARGSEFAPVLTGPLEAIPNATVYYTTTQNPKLSPELGLNPAPIGEGAAVPTWVTSGISNWSAVTALKIVYNESVALAPNTTMTMTSGANDYLFRLRVPNGAPSSSFGAAQRVAWLSFAVKSLNDSFTKEYTETVEAPKVGLVSVSVALTKTVKGLSGSGAEQNELRLTRRDEDFAFTLRFPVPADAPAGYANIFLRDEINPAFVADAQNITVKGFKGSAGTDVKNAGSFAFAGGVLSYNLTGTKTDASTGTGAYAYQGGHIEIVVPARFSGDKGAFPDALLARGIANTAEFKLAGDTDFTPSNVTKVSVPVSPTVAKYVYRSGASPAAEAWLGGRTETFTYRLDVAIPSAPEGWTNLKLTDTLPDLLEIVGAPSAALPSDPHFFIDNPAVFTRSGNALTLNFADGFNFNKIKGQTITIRVSARIRSTVTDEQIKNAFGGDFIPNKASLALNTPAQGNPKTDAAVYLETDEVKVYPPRAPRKLVNGEETLHVKTNRVFRFDVVAELRNNLDDVSKIVVTDVLPAGLNLVGAPEVRLDNARISKGVFAISGQTVAYVVNFPAVADGDDFEGKELRVRIYARFADPAATATVTNTAKIAYMPRAGGSEETQSNRVTVTPLRPETITKGVMPLTDSDYGTDVTVKDTHDVFRYRLSVKIPPADADDKEAFTGLLIVDPIDDCLTIVGNIDAVVAEGGVSGLPSPVFDGDVISLNVTDAAVLSALRGKTVVITAQARIKDTLTAADVFAAHTATSGKVPNKAYAVINGGVGGAYVAPVPAPEDPPGNTADGPVYLESNEVYISPPVGIFKLVNGAASVRIAPNETLTYKIMSQFRPGLNGVSKITLTDDVPAALMVDANTIQLKYNGNPVTFIGGIGSVGGQAATLSLIGNRIESEISGALSGLENGLVELSFSASLADTAASVDAPIVNVASVRYDADAPQDSKRTEVEIMESNNTDIIPPPPDNTGDNGDNGGSPVDTGNGDNTGNPVDTGNGGNGGGNNPVDTGSGGNTGGNNPVGTGNGGNTGGNNNGGDPPATVGEKKPEETNGADTDDNTDADTGADADIGEDNADDAAGSEPGGKDPNVPPVTTMPENNLVPTGDGVFVELDENNVPLGEWHWDDPTQQWIFDAYPPLGDLPQTGTAVSDEVSDLFGPASALPLLAAACAALLLWLRRRKDIRGGLYGKTKTVREN